MDSSEQDNRRNAASAAGQPEGTPAMAGEGPPTDWSVLPVVQGNEDSVVMVLWRLLRQEPALIVSAGYVLLSLLGLWASYFFYLRFQLSILDYLQISDFLVAGLRDPAYAGILAGGILLAILVGWPDTLRRRNPAKVEALRARHWGWRVLFSRSPLTTWDISGVRPLTGLCIAVVGFMALGAAIYSLNKAEGIRDEGRGPRVTVHLAGDSAPLAEEARLLGSSSAFVFLWWPKQHRAEAVPISAIKRMQSVVLRDPAATGSGQVGQARQDRPGRDQEKAAEPGKRLVQ
jgi:hypothetical protein